MSFSKFCEQDMEIKIPKPHDKTININLKEYKNTVSKSNLANDRKNLMKRLMELKGDFPVFCEASGKFFMVDFSSPKKKAREVNSREDKQLCGVILNGMLIESNMGNNEAKLKYLKQLNLNWEVPTRVYQL